MSLPNASTASAPPWRQHLLESSDDIRRLLERTRTVAVLGVKVESGVPANYVPAYALHAGYDIIPVPVYYPDVKKIFGRDVYRKLADVPVGIDLVNVFRRPRDIPQHLDDILAKRPKAVWFQSGIRNDEVAEALAKAGINVVQDRCLMVELRRMGR
jgi:predicted CoA-binding protein